MEKHSYASLTTDELVMDLEYTREKLCNPGLRAEAHNRVVDWSVRLRMELADRGYCEAPNVKILHTYPQDRL